MNWIKENKFLAAFLGATIIVATGLGYYITIALGNYSQANDDYNVQATELQRLHALVPYPDEENLKKQRESKDAYAADILNLRKDLEAVQFPLVPVRPEEFQDILKKTVDASVQRAGEVGTKLPAKYYLGFDVYQATPPKGEAAAPLARELKGVDLVINILLNNKVDAIVDLKRPSIPEEGNGKPGGNQQKLVNKTPIEVSFIADPNRFKRVLNDLAACQKQFLVIRSLTIKNEKQEGPKRAETAVAAGGDAQQRLSFIVGTEKLMVTAKIEMVDFASSATK